MAFVNDGSYKFYLPSTLLIHKWMDSYLFYFSAAEHRYILTSTDFHPAGS